MKNSRRRELTKNDFIVELSKDGWYFAWDIWNNTGVGFWDTKEIAEAERDNYIKLHNQGTSLANIVIRSIEK